MSDTENTKQEADVALADNNADEKDGIYQKTLPSDIADTEALSLLLSLQEEIGWDNITSEDWQTLSTVFAVLRFADGEEIMKQGEDATFWGVVLKGTLKVTIKQDTDSTKPASSFEVGPGRIIGEMAYFEESSKRSGDVTAQGECLLAMLTFDELDKLYQVSGELQSRLIKDLAERTIIKKVENAKKAIAAETKATEEAKKAKELLNTIKVGRKKPKKMETLIRTRLGRKAPSTTKKKTNISVQPLLNKNYERKLREVKKQMRLEHEQQMDELREELDQKIGEASRSATKAASLEVAVESLNAQVRQLKAEAQVHKEDAASDKGRIETAATIENRYEQLLLDEKNKGVIEKAKIQRKLRRYMMYALKLTVRLRYALDSHDDWRRKSKEKILVLQMKQDKQMRALKEDKEIKTRLTNEVKQWATMFKFFSVNMYVKNHQSRSHLSRMYTLLIRLVDQLAGLKVAFEGQRASYVNNTQTRSQRNVDRYLRSRPSVLSLLSKMDTELNTMRDDSLEVLNRVQKNSHFLFQRNIELKTQFKAKEDSLVTLLTDAVESLTAEKQSNAFLTKERDVLIRDNTDLIKQLRAKSADEHARNVDDRRRQQVRLFRTLRNAQQTTPMSKSVLVFASDRREPLQMHQSDDAEFATPLPRLADKSSTVKDDESDAWGEPDTPQEEEKPATYEIPRKSVRTRIPVKPPPESPRSEQPNYCSVYTNNSKTRTTKRAERLAQKNAKEKMERFKASLTRKLPPPTTGGGTPRKNKLSMYV